MVAVDYSNLNIENYTSPIQPPDITPVVLDVFVLYPICAVLACNTFEWVYKLFTQVFGTAIGTPLAKAFCSIFMGDFEKNALEAWTELDVAEIAFYARFVDDIFLLFCGTKEDLDQFVEFLNWMG
jgi:hypothetical protein